MDRQRRPALLPPFAMQGASSYSRPTLDIMTIALLPAEMYGHWTHCEPKVCEFQCGATMIYVSYSDDKPMESRLAVARTTVEAAFEETDNALELARQISERRNAEFWLNAKRISLKQKPLIVFAIRYPLDSPS